MFFQLPQLFPFLRKDRKPAQNGAAPATAKDHVRQRRKSQLESHPLINLQHPVEMALFWGIDDVEEHLVQTKDNYRITVHRLKPSAPSAHLRPVILWHGFMMNSEVWLTHPTRGNNLALVLYDLGYDVWLANCRGNKYAQKHDSRNPNDNDFWDFSLDQIALLDLPATVDYVLSVSGRSKLSYIGFSQGTTICFAALALIPSLSEKLNLFVALAPSAKPQGLANSLVATIIRSSPELIYLIFGRRELFSLVHFYQSMFSAQFFSTLIDKSVKMLFDWNSANMSRFTKSIVYQHIYSATSVKLMVHWFQIIREERFQMYDDVGKLYRGLYQPKTTPGGQYAFQSNVPSSFPIKQIRLPDAPPIAVFYGGSDKLLDMEYLLEGLGGKMEADQNRYNETTESFVLCDADHLFESKTTAVKFIKCINKYEHLCLMWADDADKLIFADIVKQLEKYSKVV